MQLAIRIVLEILLAIATALVMEKARGYYKYITRIKKPRNAHLYANMSFYCSIAMIGIFDVIDNMIKIFEIIKGV